MHSINVRLNEQEMIELENFRCRLQASDIDMTISEVVRMSLKSVCKWVGVAPNGKVIDITP